MRRPRSTHRLPHGLPRRLAAATAVAALATTGLVACGGGDDGVAGNSDADSDGDGEASPEEVLALAKTTFDDTSGLSITLATDDAPDGITFVEDAEGVGTHAPAFDGEITVNLAGTSIDVPVVAVDGSVYAQLPLTSGFQDVDPGEYGAPDPAGLMDPHEGFSPVLVETTDVEEGETVRGGADNDEILTEYTGTAPASAVEAIVPSASGDFEATYTITDDGELREAVFTGSFYPGADDMTYTIGFTDYGTEQDITAP